MPTQAELIARVRQDKTFTSTTVVSDADALILLNEGALDMALKAHRVLGCKSVSRSDMRYNDAEGGDGQLYLLEVNTHPGMTPYSLVPEIAAFAGISFEALLDRIIADAKTFPALVPAIADEVK